MSQSPSKSYLLKTTRSIRQSNYYGFVKSRVGEGQPRSLGAFLLLFLLTEKGCPCLFENHENGKWHPNRTVYKSSALGPLKTVPVNGYKKTHETSIKKTIGTSMVFDDPKPLKSIEQPNIFSISGHSQKL